ncbi:MAG: hypothetical protein FP831_16295 [Anaerolineae bacterium]|nr:hypothetical protein [Anaerolineae bacterium]
MVFEDYNLSKIQNFPTNLIVSFRPVSYLPVFFEHQNDEGAEEMVSLPSRAREDFFGHWLKIMAKLTIILRTILVNEWIAG